jgi:ABC-type glycerol-3-phosphate transport system permease component
MNNALRLRDLPALALVLIFVFISIAPLAWIMLAAFKPTADIIAIPPVWLPDFGYLKNFHDVLVQFWPFILNSLLATAGGTALALLFAVPTAFGLATFRFRGRDALADWILSTRMMPPIAAAVPLFVMFRAVGLLDSLPGLVIAYAGFNLPFAVWMSMSFVRRVPKDLIEAARLEGCTWMQVLWRVVLPLSRSGLAAVTTFVFIFAWNEFLLALFLTTREAKTFPVVISSFVGTGRVYWEYIGAASVIQCLPPVIFSFFMQKYIVSGITMGAVKD